MYEAPIRPTTMNEQQRRQLVDKAKIDRLAFDAAQLLAKGETDKATNLAGEGMTIAGREQFEHWLRHYATARFKITGRAVDEFLSCVPPISVAL